MVDRYIKVVVVVGTPKSKLKFISQTEIPKNPAITGNPASAVVTPLFAWNLASQIWKRPVALFSKIIYLSDGDNHNRSFDSIT